MKNILCNSIVGALVMLSSISFGQNVGIGTNAPVVPLHIFGSSSEKLRLENSTILNTNVTNEFYFKTGSWFTGGIKTIGTATAYARMGFYTYASATNTGLLERMTITDAGLVGINVINPLYQLDVNGSVNISGNTILNTLQITGGAGANKVLTSDASGNATWQNPPVTTKRVSVPFAAFHPDGNSTQFGFSYINGGWAYFNNGSNYMVAPVSIPEGALFKKLVAYVYDNSASDIAINFDRIVYNNPGVGYGGLGNVVSSGASTTVQVLQYSAPFTYNFSNIGGSYFIRVSVANGGAWDGLNLKLGWVEVEYDL